MKSFKHSGNLGDIIYSLPAVFALGGGRYYVGNGKNKLGIGAQCMRPGPMTHKMVLQMMALLKRQPYVKEVKPYKGGRVDYNLDKFREQEVRNSHLASCHLKAFGVRFDLKRPWLENIAALHISDIVVGHTGRYVSVRDKLNWKALRGYEKRCVFVGFSDEHRWFKAYSGLNIRMYPAKSIAGFAGVIKGSKLYIGNQSLGFALAEGMKHPRVLEACRFIPNTMPRSSNGYLRLNKGLLRRLVDKR